jgi:hypothetical protein
LNFISPLKKYAAVAPTLSLAFDLCRGTPLNVKLAIAESALRAYVAGSFDYSETAFRDIPVRRCAIHVLPLGQIVASEEYNGVGRWCISHTWRYQHRHRLPHFRELWVSLGLLLLREIHQREKANATQNYQSEGL